MVDTKEPTIDKESNRCVGRCLLNVEIYGQDGGSLFLSDI